MTESRLYQLYIKKWLDKQGCFYCRVEHTHIPDIYTCKNGVVTWYELKVIDTIPSNKQLRPDWRVGQLAWIKDHHSKGGSNESIKLILWVKDAWFILEPKQSYSLEELNGRAGQCSTRVRDVLQRD